MAQNDENDFHKMHEEELARELQSDEAPLPPWRKHPELERYSMGWRMGYGESYMDVWRYWAKARSREELVEYFRRYAPVPVEWADWVAYKLKLDMDPRAPRTAVEQVAAAGLVELDAWLKYWEEENAE